MGHHEQNKKNMSFNVPGDSTYAFVQGLSDQDEAEPRKMCADRNKGHLSRPPFKISEISV